MPVSYYLACAGAGFMLIDSDDPRELTVLLQPYMDLVSGPARRTELLAAARRHPSGTADHLTRRDWAVTRPHVRTRDTQRAMSRENVEIRGRSIPGKFDAAASYLRKVAN